MQSLINKINNLDCLELLKKISDNSIDAVITDPPFGINYQNPYTSKKHNYLINDDNFSYLPLAKECFRVLKDNSAIFVFTGWSEYPKHFQEIQSVGFKIKEPLICQKKPSGTHDLYGSFQSNSDWLIFAHKGKFKFNKTELLKNKRAGTIPNKGRKPVPEFKTRFPSCWFGEEFPYSSENPSFQSANNMFHPTIKSQKFIQWIIQLSTNKGDLVLDPFLGSGTTAVACLKTDRNFIGCEISKGFCDLIDKRIKNLI